MIDAGDMAPDFTLPAAGADAETVTLSELRGAPVVLFFYPKDDTPGCTNEAKEFSAMLDEFRDAGIRVFGISRDPIAAHDKFRAKHDLTVPLLSDEEGGATEAYGVWKEKSMYGKTYMGIERSTFLIDAEGKVAKAWRKVKVPNHGMDVMGVARGL